MIAHTISVRLQAATRRHVNIVAAALVAASFLLIGCGGSGVNGGVSSSAPSQTFSDSRASLPDAVSRSFAPNYSPGIESHGIWKGRTLRIYFGSESEAVVAAALQRWEDATGGFFRFERVGTPGEAQVSLTAVPATEFNSGTVGRTRYTYNDGRNELVSAEVRYARIGTDADQIRIAVHEFGHVLGIHGHSDTEPDVMFPTLTTRNVITQRDLNTLFWLYRNTAAAAAADNASPGRAEDVATTSTIACGSQHDDSDH